MRKAMWKKGLSVAMAAAMLAGPVNVPVVFHNVAIVKADEATGLKDPKTLTAVDGYYYATVNMEYADYYYGELNKVSDVSTLNLSKGDIVDATYKNGEYDAVTSATTQKSTGFAATYFTQNVQNNETGEAATGVNINGIANVQIRIPAALYEAYYNAYQENKNKGLSVYKYLENAEFSNTAFDNYKELNGDGTFRATNDEGTKLENATASITSTSAWGNWQISVEGLPSYVTKKSMEGAIIETTDGAKYGMLHEDNLWLKPKKIAFSAISFSEPHGNHMSYKHTQSLSGKTIKKITYILRETEAYEESGRGGVTQVPACDGKDIVIDNLNLKVAPYVDVTVNDVERSKDGTKVTFNNLPAGNDFEVTKITKGTGKGVPSLTEDQYSYKDGVLTLNSSVEASIDTAYYVTLESKSGSYATVKVTAMVKPLLADDATITAKDVTYNPKGIKVFVDTSKVPEDAAYTVAKVKNGSKVLSEDSYEYKDGVLTFNKNVAVGTYVVTFESAKYQDVKVSVKVNKAKGTLTTKAKTTVNTAIGSKSFNLGAKATTGMKVSYASSNKKVATVSSNGTVSVKGTGIATITVTASGSNYNTVTKKITIKVAPKKQSVKAKTAKKKLTITWTKDSNATGYQVQIATKKNLKGAKTYTVKSYKTYKKTISKLKSKKKYYVRVRSYKTVGKTKLYGAYSTVKSYKVK